MAQYSKGSSGSKGKRSWAMLGIACLLAIVLPQAAGAMGWTQIPSSNPTGTQIGLSGVSCRSTKSCEAVGTYVESGSFVPLAEELESLTSKFVLQTIKAPAGTTRTFLNAVSCASTTFCEAVGDYENKAGEVVTLAYEWNGSKWEVQTTPNPAGATENELFGVSCVTSSDCEAVGSYGKVKENTLAEKWNGSKWEIQSSPNAPSSKNDQLWGVSCVENDCEAVGFYSTGTERVSLAELWNGSKWEIQTSPNPVGSIGTMPLAVSCSTPAFCQSVGEYETSTEVLSFGMEWEGSGKKWILRTTPQPSTVDVLAGVSCLSKSFCEAAGWATPELLGTEWGGASWGGAQTIPTPAGGSNFVFSADSCVSSSFCVAAGSYENSLGEPRTLVEEYA